VRKTFRILAIASLLAAIGSASAISQQAKDAAAKPSPVDETKQELKLDSASANLTFEIFEYRCPNDKSCRAHCPNKDDILISGGCAVQDIQDGKLAPALQDAHVIAEEHTNLRLYSCYYQGTAKMLMAQALCLLKK
jgi:hypothetical protein